MSTLLWRVFSTPPKSDMSNFRTRWDTSTQKMVFVEDCLINTYWLGYYRISIICWIMMGTHSYGNLTLYGRYDIRRQVWLERKICKGIDKRVLNGVFYFILFFFFVNAKWMKENGLLPSWNMADDNNDECLCRWHSFRSVIMDLCIFFVCGRK